MVSGRRNAAQSKPFRAEAVAGASRREVARQAGVSASAVCAVFRKNPAATTAGVGSEFRLQAVPPGTNSPH